MQYATAAKRETINNAFKTSKFKGITCNESSGDQAQDTGGHTFPRTVLLSSDHW